MTQNAPPGSSSADPLIRRIAILSVPGVQMLNVTGPMDVFFEANKQTGYAPKYVVDIVGLNSEPIKALNGTRFMPDETIHTALGEYDTVLVAGSPGIRDYEENPELIEWLVARARQARRVGATCTGAFLLAHAGLLDGRRATTHWNSTARMTRTFPSITVDPSPVFVKDGTVYTTAGVTASMDLALALVEEDHGRKVALRIAKELILFMKRPGGQAATGGADFGKRPYSRQPGMDPQPRLWRSLGDGPGAAGGDECPQLCAAVQTRDAADAGRLRGSRPRRGGPADTGRRRRPAERSSPQMRVLRSRRTSASLRETTRRDPGGVSGDLPPGGCGEVAKRVASNGISENGAGRYLLLFTSLAKGRGSATKQDGLPRESGRQPASMAFAVYSWILIASCAGAAGRFGG
jgi:putative intracellular protease/amidase